MATLRPRDPRLDDQHRCAVGEVGLVGGQVRQARRTTLLRGLVLWCKYVGALSLMCKRVPSVGAVDTNGRRRNNRTTWRTVHQSNVFMLLFCSEARERLHGGFGRWEMELECVARLPGPGSALPKIARNNCGTRTIGHTSDAPAH